MVELFIAAAFIAGLALGAWWACTPGPEKEVLKALRDVPKVELQAWVAADTATRFRRQVALAELRRRKERRERT